MRALQYDAYGPVERLSLRDAPSPRPAAGPLVRVTVAALNPKDALIRKGKFKVLSGRRLPKRCGVDFAGVVEAPYDDLRAGDAVFGALSELRYGRGASVLINGASGGVGTVAVQIARILGARVTTVSSTATAALCRSPGADETLDYARLDEALGGARFDVVFDVFGNLRFARPRPGLRRHGVFVS